MDSIRALCAQKNDLTAADVAILEQLALALQHVAELNGCDAFIDCLDRDGVAFVAAESNPRFYTSRYGASVVGQDALFENEPAVYHAFERGVPIHDTRATTQENLTVRQDVTPIANADGRIIGVMICERDVSRETSLEGKLDAAERERQELFRRVVASGDAEGQGNAYVREAYHRIKNDLQMIASNCNVRMRQAVQQETRERLYEVTQMILTVASLHDALTVRGSDEPGGTISLRPLLQKIVSQMTALTPTQGTITIDFNCDEIFARTERAMTAALVLTELITNAVAHAFPSGSGAIRVSVHSDHTNACAVVADNGVGIGGDIGGSRGLSIVSTLVTVKLGGQFSITSDGGGTTATFSFLP